jgi:hypothetical protein
MQVAKGDGMRKLIGLAILLLFSTGCYSDKGSSSKKAECHAPSNSYEEGSGHYAGFEWAQSNGGGCNGNSDSFNDGCEEYHRQMDAYEKCMSENK